MAGRWVQGRYPRVSWCVRYGEGIEANLGVCGEADAVDCMESGAPSAAKGVGYGASSAGK